MKENNLVKSFRYIPGDFVKYGGKIYKIILSRSNNTYSVISGCYLDSLDLAPIPLTLGVLEKNGWTRSEHHVDEDNFEWYVYTNPKVEEIVIQYYPGEDELSVFYYGDSEMLQIKYVHELQHLLFGLNINYEIELC